VKSTNVTKKVVAVVIPCYKVQKQIIGVLNSIGNEIDHIIVVDDCCPDNSADLVEKKFLDERLILIRMEKNSGVGGAVIQGYKKAIEMKVDVIVKLDGDGQMDPSRIADLIDPIVKNKADYTKGNRFFNVESLGKMPAVRLIGNAGLSFLSKLSTGYWNIFDPNNGFTAVDSKVLKNIPLNKIEKRYFFESDMLFRLNLARAVVIDVPIEAIYGDEISNLSAGKSIFEFSFKHFRNLLKRIFYNYFLREFSVATLNLILGISFLFFGIFYGGLRWIESSASNIGTNQGALFIITISIVVGIQFLLSFFSYDIAHEPRIKSDQ